MPQDLDLDALYWLGKFALVGLLCGLWPLMAGMAKRRPFLGIMGMLACIVSEIAVGLYVGMPVAIAVGLILTVPIALVFVAWIFWRDRPMPISTEEYPYTFDMKNRQE
jgi:hypothetical protein